MSSDSAVVLVVDDEPDVVDSFAMHVEDRYTARRAYSGEEAIERLDEDVDVVLLDRRMPDMVGDEVLAYIRDENLGARVAMVTAVDADFDIIDMPFDDYVIKPVTRAELLDTVDRLLTCSEYERTVQEFYSVSSKYAALVESKPEAELRNSDEFAKLQKRRDRLREQLEETIADLDERDYAILFGDLEADR